MESLHFLEQHPGYKAGDNCQIEIELCSAMSTGMGKLAKVLRKALVRAWLPAQTSTGLELVTLRNSVRDAN